MACVGKTSATCDDVLDSGKDGAGALLWRKVLEGPASETTAVFSPPPPTLLDCRVETMVPENLYLVL